jgi:hypothetical protein
VILVLIQPEQKLIAFLLADSGLQQLKPLPEDSQFIHWLGNDTILLRKAKSLAELDIAAGTILPIFEPTGWTVNTVTPGTNIQACEKPDSDLL